MNRALIGLASGAVAGYAIARAVQASRPTPQAPPRRDAGAYGRVRRAFSVSSIVRSSLGTLAFAYGPAGQRLSRAVQPLPEWLAPGAFAALATLAGSVVELPVSLVEEHRIERRYDLSNQSLNSYLSDAMKATAIEVAVTAVLAIGAGRLLRRFKRTWPLLAAGGAVVLYALANLVVPVYILPLFNRFDKLEGPLETRLRALASRFGVGDADILTMNMSKQTKKANAFVTGIGSTHRIVIGDTLIDGFTPEEIEFVVAHELGHYVHRDTWRLIAAAGGVTALLLAVAASLTHDDPSNDSLRLARIAAVMGLGSNLLRPALSAFSRSREWAADRFAVETTRDPAAGAAAFARLRDQNLAEDDVPGWYEFLFASHPSLGKRIAALRDERVHEGAATDAR